MSELHSGPSPASGGEVWILSRGVQKVIHLTLEVVLRLQEADRVHYLDGAGDVDAYLASIGARGENAIGWYREGEPRSPAYGRVVDAIVGGALQGRRVAYLAQGNAPFLDRIATLLMERCDAERIPCRVAAGVSSIDTILADLLLSGGVTGLQCYEATGFHTHRPHIDPSVPLLLFQVGLFRSSVVQGAARPTTEQLAPLARLLGELYPPEMPWFCVISAEVDGQTSSITRGRVAEGLPGDRVRGGTLVIPGSAVVRLPS